MTMSQNISASPEETTTDLTDAQRHRLLGNQRRQRLLAALAELSTPTDIDELATAIADRNPELEPSNADTVQRIKVSLHHQHLPMLDSFDILEYDVDDKQVLI